jgi:predicted GNAT family N-acyltransferase
MITILKLTGVNDKWATTLFDIRRKVFVDEQNVPAALEFDIYEQEAFHFIGFYNEVPCATARWRNTEKGIKLERFAVLPLYRNNGIGAAILKYVLNDIKPHNKETYLHAQVRAKNFYLKHQFKVEGSSFFEANIEHYVMTLKTN